MNINRLYSLSHMLLMASLVISLTSCSEWLDDIFSDSSAGQEEVLFTTAIPNTTTTRSAKSDYETAMGAYQPVNEAYEFTIGMYAADGTLIGTSIYQPVANDAIGTLTTKKSETPLYWPSTTEAYGFKATAGTETLSDNQSKKEEWLAQDRLEGFGYIQKWEGDEDSGTPIDQLDALNYHSAKEWRKLNSEVKLMKDDDDYKKIPLYLQHQRSLITIILKADEGVSRKALNFNNAENDLSAKIFSYDTDVLEITPLAGEEFIDYDEDKNGAAEAHVSTTRYDAIVEPHDYSEQPATDLITKISLSGQHYSFYAGNDSDFENNKDSYKLEAGKHLIITVTLSRNSRKVMMTAYIEDWTEDVTNTICDDYGNAGDPIMIENRQELIDFLSSESQNKPGNIALVTNDINLEDWSTAYDLRCTLNLGGCTLLSNYRFLNEMNDAASLLNGTIQIGAVVDAAIATTNGGTIEDVKVTTKNGSDVYATVAGAVVQNTGTISRCRSSLRVTGTTAEYVGGIAATSTSTDRQVAIIDACMVTNRVSGGSYGGGIVGLASGNITNNTFEYGITLLQDKQTHKNIVGAKDADHSFTAANNAWPTTDEDLGLENTAGNRYDGIIDSGDELKESTKYAYNSVGKRYRLAQDFTVTETTGNVTYELDGNNKQISTEAMIFNAITGQVHDLTVFVSKSLATVPDKDNALDAIAPLAFELHGESATIEHVKVKMADGTKIQASNPAGMVVWLWGGATINNCETKVNLFADVETDITQGRKFAGGLVSTVSQGTITQCILHSGSTFAGTTSTIIYYGGIVGGIELKEGSNETPALTLTDCTSFATMAKDSHHGGILGNALQATVLATKDCQGNWWSSDCNGVGTYTGYSIEAAIGKRNALTPTEENEE
ncbi:fimbrillin family protein [Prevotella sp. E13-17]|uniref:fimbrillin family protein n=1 Tax=Prevotella sp. E13-17 TaxID=2913616 RepID=UPI001EDB08D8|nr:fimbrillin family protein [Prevotella sp. E13-17]UKK50940.1 fimbrillin family protein [Prevotella sp. E13-17]